MANTNLPTNIHSKVVDHTNKVFNRWTVLSFFDVNNNGMAIWTCQCSCGTIRNVYARALISGSSKSCGCLRIERLREVCAHEYGKSAAKCVYSYYKRSAKQRKYQFCLSFQRFLRICSQNCFYCGVKPQHVTIKKNTNGPYIHNGIDRINNKLGYIDSNVVPCCKVCNRAKSDMTLKEFNIWRQRVSDVVRLEKAK